MPHFENLDQYEAKNPKSGKREIIPIAPHSLQASDYRPRRGNTEPLPKKKRLGEFKEMTIEPISVQQMEKEFKAAGKKRKRSRARRQGKSFWKKVVGFLRSLIGATKKPGKNRQRNRSRGQQNKHSKAKTQRNPNRRAGEQNRGKPGKNHSNQSGQQDQKFKRKKKKHKNSNNPANQQTSKNTNAGKEGFRDSNQESKQKKRNRRNRGRGNRPGQSGNRQSYNP